MTKAKVARAILSAFVTTPIWLYLLYKVLEAVNASELMWFLFYIYIPATIIGVALVTTIEDKK